MKTNIGLVEYCLAQLGNPYWYGGFGQIASESLFNQKKKQYPKYYTANDFKSQYGKRVHDCVGLIKGYLWSDTPTSTPKYNASQDKDVSGMKANCTVKGDIKTMPDIPGLLVFMNGHVGVYIGKKQVIEARGHAYGVVQTKLKDRQWTEWGYLNWIEYINEKKKEEEEMRFNKIEEIPDYARATIQKLIDKNILKGNEKGLDLSEDMVRMIILNDRVGLYDNL